MAKASAGASTRVEPSVFIERFITKFRNIERSKGVHVVFSGLNDAMRQYYGREPREITDQLVADGVIVVNGARGGAMVYLAADAPERANKGAARLAEMGLS